LNWWEGKDGTTSRQLLIHWFQFRKIVHCSRFASHSICCSFYIHNFSNRFFNRVSI